MIDKQIEKKLTNCYGTSYQIHCLMTKRNIQAVQEYACQLPKIRLVLDTLQLEVF